MRATGNMDLTDVFVKAVIDSIMTGEYRQGDKLPTEREYCDRLFVSRSVVNRGLRRLEAMGFVEVLPRKGTFVRDVTMDGGIDAINAIIRYNSTNFSPEFFEPLLETRRSFETSMMLLAAERHEEQQCLRAETYLEQMAQTEDPLELAELSFHVVNAVICSSANMMLPLLINTFREVYIAMGLAVFSCGFKEVFLRDWTAILDAVRAGDGERARAIDTKQIAAGGSWMREHYMPGATLPVEYKEHRKQ